MRVASSITVSPDLAADEPIARAIERQVAQQLRDRWNVGEVTVERRDEWFTDEDGGRHDVVRFVAYAEASPV